MGCRQCPLVFVVDETGRPKINPAICTHQPNNNAATNTNIPCRFVGVEVPSMGQPNQSRLYIQRDVRSSPSPAPSPLVPRLTRARNAPRRVVGVEVAHGALAVARLVAPLPAAEAARVAHHLIKGLQRHLHVLHVPCVCWVGLVRVRIGENVVVWGSAGVIAMRMGGFGSG